MRVELEFDGVVESHEVVLSEPQTLTQWLRHRNHPLNTRCGERGLCRACVVEVVGPDGPSEEVQGCLLPLRDGLRVRVPAGARLAYRPQVMDRYEIGVPYALDSEWGSQGIALAADIGTTTVSVVALDLGDGSVIGTASAFNQQIALGDDVLTRINLCRTEEDALARLAHAVWEETLLPLAREAAGDRFREAVGWTLAGNATMLHLAARVNPGPMGVSPFPVPVLESVRAAQAEGEVRLLPHVAAYVGADIVAGLVATGFAYEQGTALFVDIGTNGEIVCHHQGRFVGCATAAGPAFEGSGLRCGVRAGDGAIAHIDFANDQMRPELLGKGKPIGICGSAYIDFLAGAYAEGWLTPSGRAKPGFGAPTEGHEGAAFRIALGHGKRPIEITERDIARLLQAKAAIAAGVQTLLAILEVRPEDVERVYLAGGFGMHLRLGNAIACGLLPGFREEQVHLVGNSSLAGAHLAALDRTALQEMERLARGVKIVELNLHPDFEDIYLDQLSLEW